MYNHNKIIIIVNEIENRSFWRPDDIRGEDFII